MKCAFVFSSSAMRVEHVPVYTISNFPILHGKWQMANAEMAGTLHLVMLGDRPHEETLGMGIGIVYV